MRRFSEFSVTSLGNTISRLADHAEANLRSPAAPLEAEVESLRESLEATIDSYRYAAIGVAGVFESDGCQSIATILAQSVVERLGLTTTIARIAERGRVREAEAASLECSAWQAPLRRQSLNLWPSPRVDEHIRAGVDDFDLLHWLRAESEFTLLTFDSLGDVLTRLPLVRRLDGLVIVNSGKPADLDLMASATEMLERRGVRVIGQVRNRRELGGSEPGTRVGVA